MLVIYSLLWPFVGFDLWPTSNRSRSKISTLHINVLPTLVITFIHNYLCLCIGSRLQILPIQMCLQRITCLRTIHVVNERAYDTILPCGKLFVLVIFCVIVLILFLLSGYIYNIQTNFWILYWWELIYLEL